MHTTRNLILLALILAVTGCSLAGNSEAVSIQTVEPGVQKVTPLVDRSTFLPNDNATAPWYRIYDDQTGEWYPATKNANGEWELTKKGMAMRKDDLEALAEPDEDKITEWRNDTRGFSFTPKLTGANATGQGLEARPTPQLDLERNRDAEDLDGQALDAPAPDASDVINPLDATDPAVQSDARPEPTMAGEVLDDSRESAGMDNMSDAGDVVDTVSYGVEESTLGTREQDIPVDASAMRLEARAPTWITAVVDGSDKRDFYIRSGQAVDLYFGSSVTLEVGHAPSVQVYLDGEPYALDPEGETTIRRP